MKPIFQISLNFLDLDEAIEVAERIHKEIDWIGIGGSLIKCNGLRAVRDIKEEFPEKTIIADMGTVSGSIEVNAAARAGADVVTISGHDSVIGECIEASRSKGIKLMAEMKGDSILERSKSLEELGIDYLWVEPNKLEEIFNSVRIPIAVTCPINPEVVGYALEMGASIVILDGATMADKAVKEIKEAVVQKKGFRMKKEIPITSDLEKVSSTIDDMKYILASFEEQRRLEEERRREEEQKIEIEWKRVRREAAKVEEEGIRVDAERGKLREEQIRVRKEIEEKILKHEKSIAEEFSKIAEWRKRIDQEFERIKDEWNNVQKNQRAMEEEKEKLTEEYNEIKEIRERMDEDQREIAGEKSKLRDAEKNLERERREIEKRQKELEEEIRKIDGEWGKIENEIRGIKEGWDNIEIERIERSEREVEEQKSRIDEEFKGIEEGLIRIKEVKRRE